MEFTWPEIESVLLAANRVYLWGPPGIGKTYVAQEAHRNLGSTVYSITLTEETPAAELRGHYIPNESGAFTWHDGPVVRAMREGAVLILNEITHASPDAWSFLHPVLENAATARLTLPTGETVISSPGMFVIATDNVDPKDLPEALRDRFTVRLHVTDPHPDAIRMLPDEWQSTAIGSIEARGDRRLSLRAWLEFQRMIDDNMLPSALAAKVVFGNNATGVLEVLTVENTSAELAEQAENPSEEAN